MNGGHMNIARPPSVRNRRLTAQPKPVVLLGSRSENSACTNQVVTDGAASGLSQRSICIEEFRSQMILLTTWSNTTDFSSNSGLGSKTLTLRERRIRFKEL